MLTLALFAALVVSPQGTIEPREGNRLLPKRLRSLPVGILAMHNPNPVHPVKEDGVYVWKHDTTVKSLVGDLQLVEYGSFIYTDAGWMLRAVYKPEDFARIYRCPGAKLRKGVVYTDPTSWRRSPQPIAGDAMWFYIAKDASGRIYKGIAPIETEGQ
jgi:hypothetical protein